MTTLRKHLLIWLPLVASVFVALLMHLLAREAATLFPLNFSGHRISGPVLCYYPPAIIPYLFPIPLLIWAVFLAIRKNSGDHPVYHFAIATLSISLFSLAFCIMVIHLPFIINSAGGMSGTH